MAVPHASSSSVSSWGLKDGTDHDDGAEDRGGQACYASTEDTCTASASDTIEGVMASSKPIAEEQEYVSSSDEETESQLSSARETRDCSRSVLWLLRQARAIWPPEYGELFFTQHVVPLRERHAVASARTSIPWAELVDAKRALFGFLERANLSGDAHGQRVRCSLLYSLLVRCHLPLTQPSCFPLYPILLLSSLVFVAVDHRSARVKIEYA